jgi:hypothetical protein
MATQRTGRCAWVLVVALLQACGGGGGSPATGSAAPAPAASGTPDAPGACRKAVVPDPPRATLPGLGQGVPEADAHRVGQWSPVLPWTLIPIHAALTPDGRVMSFGTTAQGKQTGRFVYSVWDPALGTGLDAHLVLPNTTQTDLFCSAQVLLPQSGRMFMPGGDNFVDGNANNLGNADSTVFDPSSNGIAQGATMHRARWYGTPTMLVDGEVLVNGGSGQPNVNADRPEVRQLDGTFRLLSDVDTSMFNYYYPRGYTARDGRVFGFDNNRLMYFIDPKGTGRLSPAGGMTHFMAGDTASAALFRPGRVLVAGGATTRASTIDFTGPHAVETPTESLTDVRERLNLTVLPDGRVLGTGGSGVDNELIDVTNYAQAWSPDSGRWTRWSSGQVARLYHSIALLLPDGSVLVGAGGAPGPLVNTNAELFFPPYLFEDGGRWAARPRIVTSTPVADPGGEVTVQVDHARAVTRLTLVKFGAVTHQVNFEQRFVELPIETSAGGRLTTRLPRNAGDLPPGFWMLFALDDRGVPSVAATLRVNVAADPGLDVGWTPTFGGALRAAGDSWRLSCEVDEVMAGVHGTLAASGAAATVGRVGPLCVRRDAAGRWVGMPVARGLSGGTGGTGGVAAGAAFERRCEPGEAVVGLRGRAGAAIDALQPDCRPLSPEGRTAGALRTLEAAGGAGGGPQPPLVCRDAQPAAGLYGRTGSALQALGLLCGTAVASAPLPPPAPTPAPAPAPAQPAPAGGPAAGGGTAGAAAPARGSGC